MAGIQLSINGSSTTQTNAPWVRPIYWRVLQTLVWFVGVFIFFALIFKPKLGLYLLWNGLIPIAPALIALAPGLWRNLCPLGSTALFPRHMGWSKARRINKLWQGRFMLMGVFILFAVIPLRHVVLNTDGHATAIVIAILAMTAVSLGFIFDWKSAWCSGMCPIHQVEKLYGSSPRFTFNNAHCRRCRNCVVSCPDSVAGVSPVGPIKVSMAHALAGTLMIGAFPGFVWGWFHVPSYAPGVGWSHIPLAYSHSFVPASITLAYYLLLKLFVSPTRLHIIQRLFAASAVSCYYWYRLPWLLGLNQEHPESVLIDLSVYLPEGMISVVSIALGVLSTGFFMWVLLGKGAIKGQWLVRPPYAGINDPSFP